jgi:hypothetical protein
VRFGDSREFTIKIIKPLIYGLAFEPFIITKVVTDNKTLP